MSNRKRPHDSSWSEPSGRPPLEDQKGPAWVTPYIVHIDLVHAGLYDAAVALTTTSYAVLGLLSIAPMSGYDLHQAVDRSVRHLWPVSKSQVYAELARLEPLGLIRGTDVPQERLPDKRVFRLTDVGEEELDQWLQESDLEPPQFRLPFLLRTLFGHRLRSERTAELLDA